jgi:hypothetical protein
MEGFVAGALPGQLVTFIDDLPTRYVINVMRSAKLRQNEQKWERNDFNDIADLPVAAVYCDVVLTREAVGSPSAPRRGRRSIRHDTAQRHRQAGGRPGSREQRLILHTRSYRSDGKKGTGSHGSRQWRRASDEASLMSRETFELNVIAS